MKPIKDAARTEHYGALAREMMLADKGREYEFNSDWVRSHGWNVVPVESMARIPVPDIPRIVSALKRAGYAECIAIFNEPDYIQRLPQTVASDPPSDLSTCHVVTIDEADFQDFNRELGIFRSVLFPEDRAWAISCNEWYNLFAGKPGLLEALLGQSIDQARQEFEDFAAVLAKGNPEEPLLKVAERYAAL